MAKTNPEKNRLAEIIILLIVLICVLLIVADLRINVVDQLDSQEGQGELGEAHVKAAGFEVFKANLQIILLVKILQATVYRPSY